MTTAITLCSIALLSSPESLLDNLVPNFFLLFPCPFSLTVKELSDFFLYFVSVGKDALLICGVCVPV